MITSTTSALVRATTQHLRDKTIQAHGIISTMPMWDHFPIEPHADCRHLICRLTQGCRRVRVKTTYMCSFIREPATASPLPAKRSPYLDLPWRSANSRLKLVVTRTCSKARTRSIQHWTTRLIENMTQQDGLDWLISYLQSGQEGSELWSLFVKGNVL